MDAELPIKHYIESEEYVSLSKVLDAVENFNRGIAEYSVKTSDKTTREQAVAFS